MFKCCKGKGNKRKRSGENEQTRVEENNQVEERHGRKTERPTSASQVYPLVSEPDSDMKRQKKFEDKDNDMTPTINQLEQQVQEGNKKITKMKKDHLKDMKTKQSEHQHAVEQLKQKQSQQEHRIQQLENENSKLLTRISAMASAKLTDGNPNIADLSDENRPTKLAEQFSELYDNEWTDAFEVLKASGETCTSEEDASHILLKALCAVYIACTEKANQDRKRMEEATLAFLGGTTPPFEMMKQLKDQRKKNIGIHVKQLKQDMKATMKTLFPDKTIRKEKKTRKFLKTCLHLCWLMVVQDPPVFIDVHIEGRKGEEYDKNTLKPYTKSGHYIDYIVWPPLYLHEGGNLLCKGVAQGTSKKSDESSTQLTENQPGKQTENELSEQEESDIQPAQQAVETTCMVDICNTNNNNEQNECMNITNIESLSSTNLNSVDIAPAPRNESESEHTERMEIQQSKDNHGKELEKHTEQQGHVTDEKDLKKDMCKTTRSLTDDKDLKGRNNKRAKDVESVTFQDKGTASITENIEHRETKDLGDRHASSLHSNELTTSSDLEKHISETESNTGITESKTGQDDEKDG